MKTLSQIVADGAYAFGVVSIKEIRTEAIKMVKAKEEITREDWINFFNLTGDELNG